MKTLLAALTLLIAPILALAQTTPAAPGAVTAVSNDDGSVTLSWLQVPNAQGYDLYFAASDTALSALPNTINGGAACPSAPADGCSVSVGNVLTYTLAAGVLPADTVVDLTAWNCGSVCADSAFSPHTTLAAAATGTQPVTVSTTPSGSAQLSWTAATTNTDGSTIAAGDLVGFKIYRSTSAMTAASSANLLASIPSAGTTSYTDSNLQAGTFVYGVTELNAEGMESALSPTASLTLAAVVPKTPGAPTLEITCVSSNSVKLSCNVQ